MASARMRRVDESVRAVLSEAITKELKDPRVGFVTVTSVKTSPDLRHARVYVSVLGDDAQRADTLAGLRSAHGYLQRRLAGELTLKHTPTIEFEYDDSVDRGMRISALIDRVRARRCLRTASRSDREAVLAELRVTRQADRRHSREPRRRRARLAGRDAGDPRRARQGLHDVHRRGRVSAAGTSTGSCRWRDCSPSLRPTSRSARSCSSTAATSSAIPPRRFGAPGRTSSTSTTTTTTPASARSTSSYPQASCTAEIVWDLMHGLGVAPTPSIAEALYVGLITDTGRFMYENTAPRAHQMAAELIEAGVDVHDIYRRVYEGVPFGKLALLARGLANVERYDDGRLTVTALSAEDFDESGRRGELFRGRGRPPARGRGHRRGRARARPDRRTDGDGAQGLAAGQRRPRRRVGDRPGAGGGRPPPGRRVHHRRWSGTSWSRSCARRSQRSWCA